MKDDARSGLAFLTRSVLLALGFACAYQLLNLADWHEDYGLLGWALAAAFAMAALALLYLALRLPWPVARRITAELLAVGAALVLAEVAIAILMPSPDDRDAARIRAAERLGLPFDTRSLSEVVADLRSRGVDAYPRLGGVWAQIPAVRRRLPEDLYVLSHASNVTVVECNESGKYHTFRTDELGFNNPPGLVSAGNIDIALVGESYVLGHCLPTAQSLAGRIRARYPRTANFGFAGIHTLTELGVFREYVEPLRPRIVIWAINPNFVAAAQDMRDPLLPRYLDAGYSQGLARRQPEIDRLVREIAIPVQEKLDAEAKIRAEQSQKQRLLEAWRLPEIRNRLGRVALAKAPAGLGVNLTVFRQSLALARDAAEGWGGKLVVVLLPIYAEVVAHQIGGNLAHHNLAREVGELGIPVVNGVELFEQMEDPAALFTLRINNHPNADGYALLAGRVLEEIRTHESGSWMAGAKR